ncbi:adenosylcobinamide-GDP ribazoletransferase [Sphingomonas changnyeongensis]|uniref:Adenosylcobinamide-GDP ribazoletransferase n=1 Tax=Sphingomonas changnyeongensis TaxID=2698679 RepID=A0A7Z2NY58_9SPHN|nr:adenosylcobinamide-GDP ribazoletransferase [Sphingomonas changnyeongensis]QHL91562.1 adenosylcobinamide-GDP ribazoletransferase [Sphingomonas changnyeongensis]
MIARIADEGRALLAAIQFLTRLPVPGFAFDPRHLAMAVRWYPLVGALIGLIAALVLLGAARIYPAPVAVLLALAVALMATGGFHEDGLADLFDGLGVMSRARMLEVMRDSRLGSFGALALMTVLALKAAALIAMAAPVAAAALIAGHALGRLSSVLVIATSRYVRDAGTAKPVADAVGPGGLAFAVATGAGAAWAGAVLAGLPPVALGAGLAGAAAGHVLARALFERRLGGYTGDCLGAVQQLSETGLYLGVLAWLGTA